MDFVDSHWYQCWQCRRGFSGTYAIVLTLAREHMDNCTPKLRVTTCLDCLTSPTGVCARHAVVSAGNGHGAIDAPAAAPNGDLPVDIADRVDDWVKSGEEYGGASDLVAATQGEDSDREVNHAATHA